MKHIFLIALFISSISHQTYAREKVNSSSAPQNAKASLVSIQSLEYKIFDRQTGKFLGAKESPSDPVGMHNDIFVEVKLKGHSENDKLYKVILTATTSKTSDEARGDVKATAQKQIRDSVSLSNNGEITTIPFLIRFECNPMSIKVELPELKISKQIQAILGCME